MLDGQAWKARVDGSLTRPTLSCRTPYAVVVPFSGGQPVHLRGPSGEADLQDRLSHRTYAAQRPTAIRIDGRFESVQVRSVPKQRRPYPLYPLYPLCLLCLLSLPHPLRLPHPLHLPHPTGLPVMSTRTRG